MKNNKGVTLVSLVVTIAVLIILASITTYSGVNVIRQSKLNKFTTEMKIMQTEVNNLYDRYSNGEIDVLNIGKELDSEANNVFTGGASGITDSSGYRYYDRETTESLGIEGVEEEFYVNVEKRRVISRLGIEYEGEKYYALAQLPNGLYNVEYENKNTGKPTFKLSCDNWTDGRSNIKITDIEYSEGYIEKWEVKYKLEGQENWNTSEDLSFFVNTPGMYTVKIVNGDVESEEKQIEAVRANAPEMLEGMTETTFKLPEGNNKGEVIGEGDTGFNNKLWYDYGNSKWANATTKDGSMWVWIPRYAYKITYNNPNNKSEGGTIDVRFLIGTSDKYYDYDGKVKIAKRATSKDEIVDTTSDYYVHPAFTNETELDFANGGWDKELKGIWVAKFEAGYASGNNDVDVISSRYNYERAICWVSHIEAGEQSENNGVSKQSRNWLDGIYGENTTSIKYPVFQPITYSMNYINISEASQISRLLTDTNNIYGLNKDTTDSHLMKNSEWGSVSYLSWSKYGTNKIKPHINNINANSESKKRDENITGKTGLYSVYAITGLTTGTSEEKEKIITQENIESINNNMKNEAINEIYSWNQIEGQKASSTLNMYGIYDLSGGLNERTAGFILNNRQELEDYGKSIAYENEKIITNSTKYVSIYPIDIDSDNLYIEKNEENRWKASYKNFQKNIYIFGDAIRETSSAISTTWSESAWNTNYSVYPGLYCTFTDRGGTYSMNNRAGIFSLHSTNGSSSFEYGFRTVLINKKEK